MKLKTVLKTILVSGFVANSLFAIAQDEIVLDSLRNLFYSTIEDSSKTKLLKELTSQFKYNNVDSCTKYANELILLSQKSNDTLDMAYCYNEMGGANCVSGNISTALKQLLTAKELHQKVNNKEGEIGISMNIGIAYSMLGKHQESIKYLKEAFDYFKKHNLRDRRRKAAANLASAYLDINELTTALYYIRIIENDQESNQIMIHSLRATYFTNLKLVDSAEYHFKKLYKLSKLQNENYEEIYGLMGLGDISYQKRNYSSALNYYDLAKDIAIKNHYESNLVNIYEKCTIIYDSIQNYKAAYQCNIKHQELVTSIYKKEKEEELNELLTKYQTEKLQQETSYQKNLLTHEESLLASNKFLLKMLIVFTIISLIGFSIYTYVKRKSHKKLNIQKNHIENQKSKILKSINYAKRIQDSILKSVIEVSKIFPSSFIYFKPKAIVSGDFYWLKKFEEIKVVATVDCIGHGVPGAFMSLIINNLLEKYVQPKYLDNPGKILTKIHQHLINESKLNPDQQGMDMSLSIIDESNKIIRFSGARNSAYIYNNGDFKTLNATPFSVGSDYKVAPKYKTEDHSIKKNDKLYMYTDGFIDQFGGVKAKKLNNKKFKELITELENVAIKDVNSHIQNFQNDWQGELSQTDDILIFGVKF